MLLIFVILRNIDKGMIFLTLGAFLRSFYILLSTNLEWYYHDMEAQGYTGQSM